MANLIYNSDLAMITFQDILITPNVIPISASSESLFKMNGKAALVSSELSSLYTKPINYIKIFGGFIGGSGICKFYSDGAESRIKSQRGAFITKLGAKFIVQVPAVNPAGVSDPVTEYISTITIISKNLPNRLTLI